MILDFNSIPFISHADKTHLRGTDWDDNPGARDLLKDGAAVAMGASLWTAIIGTGFISGASFNPAITTSVLLVGIFKNKLSRLQIFEHITYYMAHFAGAILGSCLAWAIKGTTWALAIPESTTIGQAYLAETSGTAILILVAMIGGELRG